MLIVAALPDSDIYITSAPPFGVILTVRGEEYFYALNSGVPSPREILPKLSLFDYDGDGIDVLAVALRIYTKRGAPPHNPLTLFLGLNPSFSPFPHKSTQKNKLWICKGLSPIYKSTNYLELIGDFVCFQLGLITGFLLP